MAAKRLILRRRFHQSIVITTQHGERIVVTPYDIDRGYCRLAIQADETVRVDRSEIDERRRAEGA